MGDMEWGLVMGALAGATVATFICAAIVGPDNAEAAAFRSTRVAVRSTIDTALLLAPDVAPAGVVWSCCEVSE